MDINEMNQMYESLDIRRKIREFATGTEQTLKECFESINTVVEYNRMKIIRGMQDNRISNTHFAATTGYDCNGPGHDTLEGVYASILHGESVLIRPQLTSDIHVLHATLSGGLHSGSELLSPMDKPYDTLEEVIGVRDSVGSLKGYGVSYRQVELLEDGSFGYEGTVTASDEKTKLVTIQRSKGYAAHPVLSMKWIGGLTSSTKDIKSDVIRMAGNCYGEFMETTESTDVGMDMIVGPLIKNSGGGLAPTGGYIVGRKDYIEQVSYRLSVPELDKGVGASLGSNQQLYQGLFLLSAVASGAPKGTTFAASIYERLGYTMVLNGSESHHDIIQTIALGIPGGIISFCRGIQAAALVDSYVTPEPWDMPRYDSPIIMTVGTFIQGSSTELLTNGPVKLPYTICFQGGLTWYHARLGILKSLQQLSDDGVLKALR